MLNILDNFKFWFFNSRKRIKKIEDIAHNEDFKSYLHFNIGAYNGTYRQLRTAFLVSSYLFLHFYTVDGYFHRYLFLCSIYLFYSLYVTKTNQYHLIRQLDAMTRLRSGR